MHYLCKKYFLLHLFFTGLLICFISPYLFGQWSFKPNYYQYDASILGTNTVYRLLEDPYGFIWMVSDKGILIFNGKTFETIKIPGDEQEIVNICRYNNTVYASSYIGRLYEIDMVSLAVKEITLPKVVANEATPFILMNIINDKLYLGKGVGGSFLILDLTKNYKPIVKSTRSYLMRYITHNDLLVTDPRFLTKWIKALGNKIFAGSDIYEVHNKKLKTFYTAGQDYTKLKMVSSYLEDSLDLYVGFLQSGGLVKYANYNRNPRFNTAQSILPDVEVGDILKDRKGNIWVSTVYDGVFIFFQEGKKIKKLSDLNNLYSDDIWYIRSKNKTVDIGYKQLVVDEFKNKIFYKRWIGDTTINFNPVTLFRSYQNKAIIFGKTTNYTSYNNAKYPEIKSLYKDHYVYNNEIYATIYGQLRKFSKELDPVFHVLNNQKFNSIFLLADSVYAKGGSTGLYLNNTPTKIKDRVTKVRGYNNDILACTDNGLYIKRGERYFHITEKQGLPDNKCIQIEYYGDKYYKLLTKTGLVYIDTGSCKVVGKLNSQSLGNNTIIHHFDVEKDTVWLATNKGIYLFDEDMMLNKVKEPVIAYLYPESLTYRSEKYTRQSYEMKFNKKKQVTMVLEVLDFSPGEYFISYKVEKDENTVTDLSPVLNNSFLVSTSEPGNYRVKVFIGKDKNQVDRTLTYLLKITPLWYQTLWAKILFAISIGILLWLIIRLITRYIIKENEKKLKEKYAKLQLQSQAFFTQLNPHFVFNALTPLQSHILKNEKIESLEYLDRFSSLMRDILKNSDKMETSLKNEIAFIEKYITIQQIRFSPPFIFELNVEPGIDQEHISIPAMMLQPIVENAIEHGVKNMGIRGKIILDIVATTIMGKECIQIQISDNGPGIADNILKEGHALYILQKRVQTLQKKDGVITSLTYEPGKDGVGTVFKLILPKTDSLWT